MATQTTAQDRAPDLLPGLWIETPRRDVLPRRCTCISSRWWERITGRTDYQIITSPAGHGLFYAELRIRYLDHSGVARWFVRRRRYSALCGGSAGVVRFLTELRRQGLPVSRQRIDQARQTVHGSVALERWPGTLLEPLKT